MVGGRDTEKGQVDHSSILSLGDRIYNHKEERPQEKRRLFFLLRSL